MLVLVSDFVRAHDILHLFAAYISIAMMSLRAIALNHIHFDGKRDT